MERAKYYLLNTGNVNYPLHLPIISPPSPGASLAVNNSSPSRKLFCHVVHDEQLAVAVASDGIADVFHHGWSLWT